jgi:hypothetical protein
MPYRFHQLDPMSCPDIAARFRDRLIGCRAVNTSFDSGRIQRPEWDHVNGFAVTPVITPELVSKWPVSHEAYCDEWWVFDQPVPADFDVQPFCNYIGTRIADYKQLDFEGACRLDSYLARFKPRIVFGNNELGYVIAAEPANSQRDGH